MHEYLRAIDDDADETGKQGVPLQASSPSPSDSEAVPTAPKPVRPGRRPSVPPGRVIDDYLRSDLVSLLRWIQSDTLLRTREEMTTELMAELGFRRRGSKIALSCEKAIDAYLAETDPERLQQSRAARVDAMGARGIEVRYNMEVGWCYKLGTSEIGPVAWRELWEAARLRRVLPTTEVWHKAYGRWRPASDFPSLFA